jgi:hypothetical protein
MAMSQALNLIPIKPRLLRLTGCSGIATWKGTVNLMADTRIEAAGNTNITFQEMYRFR